MAPSRFSFSVFSPSLLRPISPFYLGLILLCASLVEVHGAVILTPPMKDNALFESSSDGPDVFFRAASACHALGLRYEGGAWETANITSLSQTSPHVLKTVSFIWQDQIFSPLSSVLPSVRYFSRLECGGSSIYDYHSPVLRGTLNFGFSSLMKKGNKNVTFSSSGIGSFISAPLLKWHAASSSCFSVSYRVKVSLISSSGFQVSFDSIDCIGNISLEWAAYPQELDGRVFGLSYQNFSSSSSADSLEMLANADSDSFLGSYLNNSLVKRANIYFPSTNLPFSAGLNTALSIEITALPTYSRENAMGDIMSVPWSFVSGLSGNISHSSPDLGDLLASSGVRKAETQQIAFKFLVDQSQAGGSFLTEPSQDFSSRNAPLLVASSYGANDRPIAAVWLCLFENGSLCDGSPASGQFCFQIPIDTCYDLRSFPQFPSNTFAPYTSVMAFRQNGLYYYRFYQPSDCTLSSGDYRYASNFLFTVTPSLADRYVFGKFSTLVSSSTGTNRSQMYCSTFARDQLYAQSAVDEEISSGSGPVNSSPYPYACKDGRFIFGVLDRCPYQTASQCFSYRQTSFALAADKIIDVSPSSTCSLASYLGASEVVSGGSGGSPDADLPFISLIANPFISKALITRGSQQLRITYALSADYIDSLLPSTGDQFSLYGAYNVHIRASCASYAAGSSLAAIFNTSVQSAVDASISLSCPFESSLDTFAWTLNAATINLLKYTNSPFESLTTTSTYAAVTPGSTTVSLSSSSTTPSPHLLVSDFFQDNFTLGISLPQNSIFEIDSVVLTPVSLPTPMASLFSSISPSVPSPSGDENNIGCACLSSVSSGRSLFGCGNLGPTDAAQLKGSGCYVNPSTCLSTHSSCIIPSFDFPGSYFRPCVPVPRSFLFYPMTLSSYSQNYQQVFDGAYDFKGESLYSLYIPSASSSNSSQYFECTLLSRFQERSLTKNEFVVHVTYSSLKIPGAPFASSLSFKANNVTLGSGVDSLSLSQYTFCSLRIFPNVMSKYYQYMFTSPHVSRNHLLNSNCLARGASDFFPLLDAVFTYYNLVSLFVSPFTIRWTLSIEPYGSAGVPLRQYGECPSVASLTGLRSSTNVVANLSWTMDWSSVCDPVMMQDSICRGYFGALSFNISSTVSSSSLDITEPPTVTQMSETPISFNSSSLAVNSFSFTNLNPLASILYSVQTVGSSCFPIPSSQSVPKTLVLNPRSGRPVSAPQLSSVEVVNSTSLRVRWIELSNSPSQGNGIVTSYVLNATRVTTSSPSTSTLVTFSALLGSGSRRRASTFTSGFSVLPAPNTTMLCSFDNSGNLIVASENPFLQGFSSGFAYIIGGLAPNSDYLVSIAARTVAGQGPLSPPVAVKTLPFPSPSSPANFNAAFLNSTSSTILWVSVGWTPVPSDTGVVGYEVVYSALSTQFPDLMASNIKSSGGASIFVPRANSSILIDNLAPGTTYEIKIRSYVFLASSCGFGDSCMALGGVEGIRNFGPFSIPVVLSPSALPPGTCSQVKVVSLNSTFLTLTWLSPAALNGNVTKFYVFAREMSDTSGVDLTTPSLMYRRTYSFPTVLKNQTMTVVVKGLTPYMKYNLSVAAVNPSGSGPLAPFVTNTTFEDLPSAPESVDIKTVPTKDTTMKVVWVKPSHPNGKIVDYIVFYRVSGNNGPYFNQSAKGPGISVEIDNLQRDIYYEVRVAAVTIVGLGELSAPKIGQTNTASSAVASASSSNFFTAGALAGIATGVVFVITLFIIFFLVRGKKQSTYNADLELQLKSMKMGVEELTSRVRDMFSREFAVTIGDKQEESEVVFEQMEISRDRLVLGRELGKGAFGVVCLATLKPEKESDQETTVAVKTLIEGAGTEELTKFLMEARLMSLLAHENLLRLVAVCTKETPFYLVTELMPKGDLKEYLRNCRPHLPNRIDPLTVSDLEAMVLQISGAMRFLEMKHVIHRDLAARNILVAENNIVKLADFGMSRNIYEADYYKKMSDDRVPVKWMAPESINDRIYTNLTDVWSFGILMWEVFSFAKAPYAEYTAMESVAAVAAGYRLPRPEMCSELMYSLMLRCWMFKPIDRPNFVELNELLIELVTTGVLSKTFSPTIQSFQSTSFDVEVDKDGYVSENQGNSNTMSSGNPVNRQLDGAGYVKEGDVSNSATTYNPRFNGPKELGSDGYVREREVGLSNTSAPPRPPKSSSSQSNDLPVISESNPFSNNPPSSSRTTQYQSLPQVLASPSEPLNFPSTTVSQPNSTPSTTANLMTSSKPVLRSSMNPLAPGVGQFPQQPVKRRLPQDGGYVEDSFFGVLNQLPNFYNPGMYPGSYPPFQQSPYEEPNYYGQGGVYEEPPMMSVGQAFNAPPFGGNAPFFSPNPGAPFQNNFVQPFSPQPATSNFSLPMMNPHRAKPANAPDPRHAKPATNTKKVAPGDGAQPSQPSSQPAGKRPDPSVTSTTSQPPAPKIALPTFEDQGSKVENEESIRQLNAMYNMGKQSKGKKK